RRELTEDQITRLGTPPRVYANQDAVLAVHWHPEFVPMDIIRWRVNAMFPNKRDELIIPTNHNVLDSYDGVFSGVEIDCYAASFRRKVQFLAHFHSPRVQEASVFKQMLEYTFRYRHSQLWELIETIMNPDHGHKVDEAAKKTGANAEVVDFLRTHTTKLSALIARHEDDTPRDMLRNKLIKLYIDTLRDHFPANLVDRALYLLGEIKRVVKRTFSLEYFYEAHEVIEEVRGLGGGIVIPHPEQFWPVLLAGYDVDGIEVWNPQSQKFTHFLIDVVHRENRERARGGRPVLIFMGDDTHLSEKVPTPARQDGPKASREIGLQPAWDDLDIRKTLIVANCDRRTVISEYRARLLNP
ncbi:MAG: hypothetical protein KC466_02050, partial [Myxococcales bacterium]|nr:hypothetical protein [Myxococcales bacterium]